MTAIYKGVTTTATLLALTLGLATSAQAVVYTLSNETENNRVIAFDIDKSAIGGPQIKEIGSFRTRGRGTGAPLGNQSAITTDESDRWMFVTNAGDGTITSMRLQEDGLEFVNRLSSNGHSPISVTVFGTMVYVLNEGSGQQSDPPQRRYDNISGFRFNAQGSLSPIKGSTRILDRTQLTAPAQVGFNKSGTVLLVTEKATNQLTTFRVFQNGLPARQPLKRTSAVPTPFGFEFGDRDFVFITEANGGSQGVTASYRIDRGTGAVSPAVDVIQQGDASCWTVLSSDQTVGYSVNTGSGSISLYRVNFDGSIEPFFGNPARQISTGNAPRDAVLTQDTRNLLTLNNGDGQVRVFNVFRSGGIAGGGTAQVPTSSTGLIAR